MVRYIVGQEPPENAEAVLEKVNISCMASEIRLAMERLEKASGRRDNTVNMALRDYDFHYEIEPLREKAMSSTGRFSGSKRLIKKVIAKAIGWYIKDLCEQESEFNADTVAAVSAIAAAVSEMKRAEEEQCGKR